MAKFNVLQGLVYDRKAHEPGDTIEAPVEHMLHPIVKGYVEPADKETATAVEEARDPDNARVPPGW
jgi:hypothetical protein